MKICMEFLDKDLCIQLEKIGLKGSEFFYINKQIINPEVIKEYGDLTDDGYYELTKDCGGELDFDYVYIYDPVVVSKNDIYRYCDEGGIPAYTIEQVLKWLREEKKIHLTIDTEKGQKIYENIIWGYFVVLLDVSRHCVHHYDFKSDSYEDAAIAGIKYVINNLI